MSESKPETMPTAGPADSAEPVSPAMDRKSTEAIIAQTDATPRRETIRERAALATVGSAFPKKERMRCMFCGGEQCKRCGATAHTSMVEPAIKGLHSTWINESIVAMQRPSDPILHAGALESFAAQGVTAVFNLTEPGEHPYCGFGVLEASGFPYSPEVFMAKGIKHFNFHWRDMTTPPLSLMNHIVTVACRELDAGGRIAVHCHAGFGRTGIAIACIIVAHYNVESSQAVRFIRIRRPGSIQTAKQESFVGKFERTHRFLRQTFPTTESRELRLLTNETNAHDGKRGGEGRGHGGAHEDPGDSLKEHKEPSLHSQYLKSIMLTLQDQQHFLTSDELASGAFRWIHKVLHISVLAVSNMARESIALAHLGITGLNKLVAKRNNAERFKHSVPTESLKLLLQTPHYMVAVNNMCEGSEESLLLEMKLEINDNIWTRFLSLSDVASASVNISEESMRRIRYSSTSMEDLYKSTSPPSSSSHMPTCEKSMIRTNSLNANSEGDYIRSKRASNNAIAQLLLDFVESRQNPVMESRFVGKLEGVWSKHFPQFRELGKFRLLWSEIVQHSDVSDAFYADLVTLIESCLHRSKLEVLSRLVSLFRITHQCAMDRLQLEQAEEADPNTEGGMHLHTLAAMDMLVAVRLSVALLHAHKTHLGLVKNRALSMNVLQIFLLKNADCPVIVNNMPFGGAQMEAARGGMGPLVDMVEVVARSMQVLEAREWAYLRPPEVFWSAERAEQTGPTQGTSPSEQD